MNGHTARRFRKDAYGKRGYQAEKLAERKRRSRSKLGRLYARNERGGRVNTPPRSIYLTLKDAYKRPNRR